MGANWNRKRRAGSAPVEHVERLVSSAVFPSQSADPCFFPPRPNRGETRKVAPDRLAKWAIGAFFVRTAAPRLRGGWFLLTRCLYSGDVERAVERGRWRITRGRRDSILAGGQQRMYALIRKTICHDSACTDLRQPQVGTRRSQSLASGSSGPVNDSLGWSASRCVCVCMYAWCTGASREQEE